MNEINKSKYRELKTRVRFTTSIDLDYNNKLDKLSEETMIPKSKLVDRALELLFSEYKLK
ncbi:MULTISPECIES: ribbon-helix-helix domain-containing protein [Clostridium]|uniref:ribbon-helix-helix domain-containing protein n=1 Tax=Clostridium TaxID=1485 RepID=UPI0004B2A53E|nr:ribbon-helix-helix domain-containing protein [Clostridium saudiense]